jgi:two-component system, OmpR family, sensor kinase
VRSSLLAQIAAIALSVMALTMLLAAVLTQQLIRVEYRQEMDRLLRQEMTEVRLGLPGELEAARGAPTVWLTPPRWSLRCSVIWPTTPAVIVT